VFQQTASGPAGPTSVVTLSEVFCAYTGTPGVETPTSCSNGTLYSGVFTSQFSNTTVQSLITTIAAGGQITDSVSATFTPVIVPEPMSFILFGSGLIGLSMLGRRLRRL
jgi:hypothetical protein